MLRRSFRLQFCAFSLFIALLFNFTNIFAVKNPSNKPTDNTATLLADNFGDFRAISEATSGEHKTAQAKSLVQRLYVGRNGDKFLVSIFRLTTPSQAYTQLTQSVRAARANLMLPMLSIEFGQIGIADYVANTNVAFYKGSTFVLVAAGKNEEANKSEQTEMTKTLAKLIAERVDAENVNAPVLLEHLPDADMMKGKADYATNPGELKTATGDKPVLDTLSFDGGTEAVTAVYPNGARLIIAEHTTPQFAADAEEKINARIAELRAGGQPVPSAFKRVGNYSVFVFDAPNEESAKSLIEQVKYQKDVRWLGTNPHAYERAQRAYANMTAEMIITVLKTTGMSVLLCLAVGGIVGGWIFMRRRAQTSTLAAYSDAGGLVRLNIDEMTPQTDPIKLLTKGSER